MIVKFEIYRIKESERTEIQRHESVMPKSKRKKGPENRAVVRTGIKAKVNAK